MGTNGSLVSPLITCILSMDAYKLITTLKSLFAIDGCLTFSPDGALLASYSPSLPLNRICVLIVEPRREARDYLRI
ncbi:hypothetical protein K439DRAFT_715737 [Ramaria rubella]|nr:hypothetical protein K439DRAFT_715737 [Ramaria rubella]